MVGIGIVLEDFKMKLDRFFLYLAIVLISSFAVHAWVGGETTQMTCEGIGGSVPVQPVDCADPGVSGDWLVNADTWCHDGEYIACGNNITVSGAEFRCTNCNIMFNGTGMCIISGSGTC